MPPLKGIELWSLNACTLKAGDLLPLAHSFSDNVHWDILCIQEGVKHRTGGVEQEEGLTIISGQGSQVGAPHIILKTRLGSRLRKWILHTNYVLASLGTTPPLIVFSLYLPAHGTTLHDFTQDLQSLHDSSPGSFIAGAADCNTQLREMPGHVGKCTGTIERSMDQPRADSLMHVLAQLNTKVPSSHVILGPTRTPWPGQRPKQQPSVIDYLFCSKKVSAKVLEGNTPTPDTNTDHQPLGMHIHAPYASRKDRRTSMLPGNW